MKLVVGTRGSKLALAQTEQVCAMLKKKFPSLDFETKIIKTTGDRFLEAPLAKIGGKGIFVKEIDEAVLRSKVQFAVHSMKDVPTELEKGLEIAAVPKREEVCDALVAREKIAIDSLPKGAVIGTSSLRRKAEILNYRGDFLVKDLRGNVDTRLRKLLSGEYDAIVMAKAGIKRLGLEKLAVQELKPEIFLPSVGQGAIAVVAESNSSVIKYLRAINHPQSMRRCIAERALLLGLGGGCEVPVGALTTCGKKMTLRAAVLSPDGREKIGIIAEGTASRAEELGAAAAKKLLEKGADRILQRVRGR